MHWGHDERARQLEDLFGHDDGVGDGALGVSLGLDSMRPWHQQVVHTP